VIRIVTKIELIGPWAMPYPSKKVRRTPFTTLLFQLSDVHTINIQTDRTKNITGLPDPDSDVDRHQNVIISWSLGHTPAIR